MKPRKWKMWAIVEGDKRDLAVFDDRAPILWRKNRAVKLGSDTCFEPEIIRVEVIEIVRKK